MRSIPVIFLICCLVIACSQPQSSQKFAPAQLEDGIETGSLTEAGIDTAYISKMEAEITAGIYPNIHSLLICRNNELVYENYWPGKDEVWGADIGIVPHHRDSLHDLRSITKSVVAVCIGIALEQGRISSVDQRVFDLFPEYSNLDTGIKRSLTVKHLLTMSSGLHWNEDVPYNDPQNSEVQMALSPDPVKYVLSQPMDTVPGVIWKYNGGTTQLLAAIIEKTTGKKVDRFAREYLFAPLGITKYEWTKYPGTDMPAAASGLRLRPRDLLKFALLCYNKGEWNGKQIVPAKWIEESFQPHIRQRGGAYGYQFWLFADSTGNNGKYLVTATGNGGQRIFFDHDKNLLVVVNAGNYNRWDIQKNAHALLYEHIYPAL